ncbi:MAG: sulfotransferase family 2 domain-containing protein [Pseudomonadota bacterium]
MNRFDSFILLAEMRTGSNLLESNLNLLDGVTCHGEAFNPSFIGDPKANDLLGMTLEMREADPIALLERIKRSARMPGFRYFHNHDPRVLDPCLDDPRCAKIILTRNPMESFVSWKIAQATGQWKLTNATHAKQTKVHFDKGAFTAHLAAISAFQALVRRRLQTTGQTAFQLQYEDLRNVEVINGLAAFLGVDARLANVKKRLKKQNPGALIDKVTNPDSMLATVAALNTMDVDQTPVFEPSRGPAVPTYVAAPTSGLLYCPLRSGPDDAVFRWLASIDKAAPDAVIAGFSGKSLRDWRMRHNTYRSFTILRHPVARAHAAFCDRMLFAGPKLLTEIRATLRRVHHLPIPEVTENVDTAAFEPEAHRIAFLAFLQFLRQNLHGQTGIRVDPSWASQVALLQGIAQVSPVDAVLREDDLQAGLNLLARQVGVAETPMPETQHAKHPWLTAIYDAEIEKEAQRAYARDYMTFGFEKLA